VLGHANSNHPWSVDDRPYVIVGANKALDTAGNRDRRAPPIPGSRQ